MDIDGSLWNFVRWESIWPLPHVILSYHAFLYTRSWIHVLCYYYLIKVVQLLLFSLLGLDYWHYFKELLADQPTGSDLMLLATNHTVDVEPVCLVDFNGLFIGGTVQVIMGILIGKVHSYTWCPSVYRMDHFHPVSFWKHLAAKYDTVWLGPLHPSTVVKNEEDSLHFVTRYGLWPLWLIFGHQKADKYLGHDEKSWRFRKIFWARWFQLTLLGTPSLLFYTMRIGHPLLRAGSIIYGFVTCSLLLWYRSVNQTLYLKWMHKKYKSEVAALGDDYQALTEPDNVNTRILNTPIPLIAINLTDQINSINNRWPTNSLINRWSTQSNTLAHFKPLPISPSSTPIQVATKGYYNTINGTSDDAKRILKLNKCYEYGLELVFNSYDVIYTVWISTCVVLIASQTIPFLSSFYRIMLAVLSVICLSLMALPIRWVIGKIEFSEPANSIYV